VAVVENGQNLAGFGFFGNCFFSCELAQLRRGTAVFVVDPPLKLYNNFKIVACGEVSGFASHENPT
jgi:hypothetical protein